MGLAVQRIGAHKPQDAAVAVVELRVVFRKGLDCVVVKKIRVVVEEVLILRVVLLCPAGRIGAQRGAALRLRAFRRGDCADYHCQRDHDQRNRDGNAFFLKKFFHA